MRRFFKRIFADLSSKKISVLAELTLPYIENGEEVLDFGCGTGLIAKYICDRKKIKMNLLDITDKRNETNLKIKVYDGKKAPYKDGSFDAVLAIFVLHHSGKPEEVLKEITRITRNRIIILEDLIYTRFDRLILTIWHTIPTILFGGKMFFNFKTDQELKIQFNKLGLKIVATEDFRFPSIKPTKERLYVLEKT